MRKKSLSQKQYFDRKRKKKSASENPVLHDESVHKTTSEESPVLHDESFHGLSVDNVLSGEMDVQMMDFISQVLKTQFKSHFECLDGLLPPSYLYGLEKYDREHSKISNQNFAVQIHIIPGHYMVSTQVNGRLCVYDSLYNICHLNALKPQLRLLYDTDVINNVIYTCPQSQGCSNLCGFFAIANVFNLLCGKNLEKITLDVQHMRTHVRNCLLSGKFESFPMLSRNKDQLYDNTDFNAQHEFQNIHKDQQEMISGPNFLNKVKNTIRKRTQRQNISKDNKENLKEKIRCNTLRKEN